jgi:hypothetical protein
MKIDYWITAACDASGNVGSYMIHVICDGKNGVYMRETKSITNLSNADNFAMDIFTQYVRQLKRKYNIK